MVAIKYIPLAAAYLSLCTGVGASVISKRKGDEPADLTAAVAHPLGSPSTSSFGGRAVSNRAAADAPSAAPAGTLGVQAKVLDGSLATLPGGLDFASLINTISGLISGLGTLPGIPSLPAPVPVPTGDISGALAAALLQSTIATLQSVVAALQALPPSTPIPSGTTDPLAALLGAVGPLLGLGGIVPSDPLGTVTGTIALLQGLIQVLSSLSSGAV